MYEEDNRAVVNLYVLNVYRTESFRDTLSILLVIRSSTIELYTIATGAWTKAFLCIFKDHSQSQWETVVHMWLHWVLLENEQIDGNGKETLRYRSLLVETKLFDIDANNFDAKESARCSRVLVITKLIASGTQCNILKLSQITPSECLRRFRYQLWFLSFTLSKSKGSPKNSGEKILFLVIFLSASRFSSYCWKPISGCIWNIRILISAKDDYTLPVADISGIAM